jgi:hypothetical protein
MGAPARIQTSLQVIQLSSFAAPSLMFSDLHFSKGSLPFFAQNAMK